MNRKIEIMDTTLRDGEQTQGVSFSSFEKLQLSRFLLEKLKVDRIEITSARVSTLEHETVRKIFDWGKEKKLLDKIEILGFIDGERSIRWIKEAGGKVLNLLTKGSKQHCEIQLSKNLKEHLNDIEKNLKLAKKENLKVNVYLEDWSNGYLNSPEYVEEMISVLSHWPIERLLLPDTLGIFSPQEVYSAISDVLEKHPKLRLDFHGHNDYSLAVANCISAVKAGVSGIHVSVNGLGERAGNSPLEAVVTVLHDKMNVQTNIQEKAITDASRLVETFSGKRVQSNRPIVGDDVFTQTAGIHADGDKKANLYANPILPERFGRKRTYALGKLAGKASVQKNLENLGIELSIEEEKKLLKRIKELGETKKNITIEDLPFLIEDMFGRGLKSLLKIEEAEIKTSLKKKPSASIKVSYKEEKLSAEAEGDGGYDAFMNAIDKIAKKLQIHLPELIDYEVRIPPGGQTDALVEAVIQWENKTENERFKTIGVATDQVISAIRATEKMLNRFLN